ncbi:transcriptional regulator [Neisseria meningitidis]|nr:transcriptional regulator [Neisseria meningitidis]MBG8613805.1 transcriptional regulator [Neisseria meningitidis]MBG8636247.1 transcriptional regulator [Neisseria meningitidis]MBG8644807.1 transcriptional regulator [Neisseria meningitidis]MBG8680064.1 transcriptional regulator [Neisseria meningitidis]
MFRKLPCLHENLPSILSCKHKRLPDPQSDGIFAATHHAAVKTAVLLSDSESEQPLSDGSMPSSR